MNEAFSQSAPIYFRGRKSCDTRLHSLGLARAEEAIQQRIARVQSRGNSLHIELPVKLVSARCEILMRAENRDDRTAPKTDSDRRTGTKTSEETARLNPSTYICPPFGPAAAAELQLRRELVGIIEAIQIPLHRQTASSSASTLT